MTPQKKVGDDRNIKPLSKTDVGAKAQTLFSQNVIMASDIEKKICQDCLDFFITAVQYLQSNLPYDLSLLHNMPNIFTLINAMLQSLSAISNLAVKIISVLNNNDCLYKVFSVKNASTDFIVDLFPSQWQFF